MRTPSRLVCNAKHLLLASLHELSRPSSHWRSVTNTASQRQIALATATATSASGSWPAGSRVERIVRRSIRQIRRAQPFEADDANTHSRLRHHIIYDTVNLQLPAPNKTRGLHTKTGVRSGQQLAIWNYHSRTLSRLWWYNHVNYSTTTIRPSFTHLGTWLWIVGSVLASC